MTKRLLLITLGFSPLLAFALPAPGDRVYTADQNSNTVSVFDPASNSLLGLLRLGNPRPDVLSPLYKGQVNVHGLGFSPDHKTLIVISTNSNSVTFVDTETNKVKSVTYVGRSPHEGFFTPDGQEVWVVVRGEDYISVIDPGTFKETRRLTTANGPGMVLFHPNGKLAFVVSSFSPEVNVFDVRKHKLVKRIPVVSPFSPFLQFMPGGKEVWMTHKDVGKVTRIDTAKLEVTGVIDTGFITNHLGFAKTEKGTFAYVTVGGENVVKVYTTEEPAMQVATIPVGALPHGIWPSDDSSRMYVGVENGDGVDVIDTATNTVLKHMPGGQAPQALVYVSKAVTRGEGKENLSPRADVDPINIPLKSRGGNATGFVVARNLGLIDSLEVFLFRLKPNTAYQLYVSGHPTPVAALQSNATGAANGTAIGPMRKTVASLDDKAAAPSQLILMEGAAAPDAAKAVLVSGP